MLIGICAIIKDCKPAYLHEWIDWHRKSGFERFFIYDNGSRISIKETLSGEKGVIVYDWPGSAMQCMAYDDQLKKQGNKKYPYRCDWIAFIDDDEFIMTDREPVKDYLKRCKGEALGINWLMFGSGGVTRDTNDRQTKKFTKRTPTNYVHGAHIKSIVRMSNKTINAITPHHFTVKTVDILNRVIPGHLISTAVDKGMWINHYWTRSENEFRNKIERGRATCLLKRSMAEFYDIDKLAVVDDFRARDKKWFQ